MGQTASNQEADASAAPETSERGVPIGEGTPLKAIADSPSNSLTLSERTLPWILQFVASIVLCVCVAVDGLGISNGAYTLAVGIVGTVLAFAMLIMRALAPQRLRTKIGIKGPEFIGEVTVGTILYLFGFVWWAVAVGIITFINPYTVASNGYFAAWLGLICSLSTLGYDPGAVMNIKALSELLVAAFVLMLALTSRLTTGQAIYGLVLSVVTVLLTALLLVLERGSSVAKAFVSPFIFVPVALMWAAAAVALTFQAPFKQSGVNAVGNGYLASVRHRASTPPLDADD